MKFFGEQMKLKLIQLYLKKVCSCSYMNITKISHTNNLYNKLYYIKLYIRNVVNIVIQNNVYFEINKIKIFILYKILICCMYI